MVSQWRWMKNDEVEVQLSGKKKTRDVETDMAFK